MRTLCAALASITLLAAAPRSGLGDDDFAAALEDAKGLYAKSLAEASSALEEAFTAAVKAAAAEGEIDTVTELVNEKKEFDGKGTLPASAVMKSAADQYRAVEKAERDRLIRFYTDVIDAYRADGNTAAAIRVKRELTAFQTGEDVPEEPAEEPKSDDPVQAELDDAKDEYGAKFEELAAEFYEDVDARVLEESSAGNLEAVEKLNEMRTAFEAGTLRDPDDDKVKFALARFARDQQRIARTLSSAYRKAIGRYKRSKDNEQVARLEAEFAEWTADGGRPPGSGKVVDLIKLVDLSKDGDRNRWAIRNNALVCDRGGLVPKIVLPYEPPEEYDFRMEFMQPKLRNELGLIMPNRTGKSFFWAVGGTEGKFILSLAGGDRNGHKHQYGVRRRGAFLPNVRYSTVVQVRKDRVRTFVNGKLIYEHRTDLTDLEGDNWRRIDKPNQLAVFTDDPTVFFKVQVTEVTGTGRRTRE